MRFAGTLALDSRRQAGRRTFPRQGAVLFEVVVALVLFVAAATVITSALNAALESVERLRLSAHAADLGVSVLSELQLGVKTWDLAGPQPFEAPFEAWTWEVVADPMAADLAAGPLQSVEVIIRHEESELVYRLSQLLPVQAPAAPGERSSEPADSWDF